MAADRLDSLRTASAGLLYQSETDAAVTTLRWPVGAPIGEKALRAYLRLAESVPVTTRDAAAFLDPMAREQDWFGDEEKAIAARWRALAALLEGGVALRVGGAATAAIYVVVEDSPGVWTGIATRVTET